MLELKRDLIEKRKNRLVVIAGKQEELENDDIFKWFKSFFVKKNDIL